MFHREKLFFSSNFLTSNIAINFLFQTLTNFYSKIIDFRKKFVRTFFLHCGLKNVKKIFLGSPGPNRIVEQQY